MKQLFIFLAFFLGTSHLLFSQLKSIEVIRKYKVFVWKFDMEGFSNKSDVINFEKTFEDVLKKKKYYQIFYVVLRKEYDDLIDLPDIDGVFKATKANMVVLGEIRSNNDYGRYDIRINFVNPINTHSSAGGKIFIPKNYFTNDSIVESKIEAFLDSNVVPNLKQEIQENINRNMQLYILRDNLVSVINLTQDSIKIKETTILDTKNYSTMPQVLKLYNELIKSGESLKIIYDNNNYLKMQDELDIEKFLIDWKETYEKYKKIK